MTDLLCFLVSGQRLQYFQDWLASTKEYSLLAIIIFFGLPSLPLLYRSCFQMQHRQSSYLTLLLIIFRMNLIYLLVCQSIMTFSSVAWQLLRRSLRLHLLCLPWVCPFPWYNLLSIVLIIIRLVSAQQRMLLGLPWSVPVSCTLKQLLGKHSHLSFSI